MDTLHGYNTILSSHNVRKLYRKTHSTVKNNDLWTPGHDNAPENEQQSPLKHQTNHLL